jgi:hypothetical protein
LGALEKSKKKNTMALRVRPRKRRFNFGNFGKYHEKEDQNFKVSAMKKKTITMEF